MLGSFDRCKYMNVCKLLNLCMFVVEKLRVIEMLGSFDRCNLILRINIWWMLMLSMNIWGMLMLGLKVGMGEC